MLEQRNALENKKNRTTLYRVVFESAFVKSAVFGLFALLLIQPVAPALAAFDVTEPEQNSSEIETISTDSSDNGAPQTIKPTDESPDSAVQDVVSEESTPTVLGETFEATTLEVVAVDETATIVTTEVTESNATTSSEENIELLETTNEVVVTPAEIDTVLSSITSEDVAVVIEDEVETVSTTTVPVVTEEVAEDIATIATSTAVVSTDSVLVAEHSSHAYEFNTDECAIVGDGSYYCSNPEKSPDQFKDGVFAAPDSGGDLEIYVRLNGEERALTSNDVDDSAPQYDAISGRIVWHSMKDDRYQVASYDMKTDKQIYLTHTTYNNMEPTAYGNITLWQAWIDNNWEIMMFDGEETLQLTNNIMQDVSPHMREGYIVWQTQFSEGWQVAVYNQELKTIEYIPSEGGLKVENPRFVLVYDSTDDNGDKQTLGYDLDNKKSFTLGSLPAELPDELPNPDQTGETRALIQNKQTAREGETEVVDVPQVGSNNNTGSTSTSTGSFGTLDLTQNATSSMAASSSAPVDIVDVIIPVYTSSSTPSQGFFDIPSLVIPPSSSTSTIEVR